MLDAFNYERNIRGIHPLILDDELSNISQEKSLNMIEFDYFSHVDLDGRTWANRLNDYNRGFWSGGQVLGKAAGTDEQSEKAIVAAFMQSPTHAAIILNPNLNYVGVGAAIDPMDGVTFFTMIMTN